MRERPIIMRDWEVRAILAGQKTMIRRVVRIPPRKLCPVSAQFSSVKNGVAMFICGTDGALVRCQLGQPGDRLWVRETFRRDLDRFHSRKLLVYRADDAVVDAGPEGGFDFPDVAWRPGIHMPRWASRITLEITDVRVERLQDISEEDAIAEGALEWARGACAPGNPTGFTAVGYFWLLWGPINGPGSWDANPWVWVIEFKKLEQQEQA